LLFSGVAAWKSEKVRKARQVLHVFCTAQRHDFINDNENVKNQRLSQNRDFHCRACFERACENNETKQLLCLDPARRPAGTQADRTTHLSDRSAPMLPRPCCPAHYFTLTHVTCATAPTTISPLEGERSTALCTPSPHSSRAPKQKYLHSPSCERPASPAPRHDAG
jgi:hypothetical protein